jgi:dynein light chain roadblock-type
LVDWVLLAAAATGRLPRLFGVTSAKQPHDPTTESKPSRDDETPKTTKLVSAEPSSSSSSSKHAAKKIVIDNTPYHTKTTTIIMPDAATGAAATASTSPSKKQVGYQEVQETVNRLAAHKGVTAVLILNSAGDILTQTGKGLVGNAKLLKTMLDAAAHYVKSIPTSEEGEEQAEVEEGEGELDEISFVRIRSKHEEILISPKNQYVLVVVQDPSIASL